jgi:hypothetical protein
LISALASYLPIRTTADSKPKVINDIRRCNATSECPAGRLIVCRPVCPWL